MIIIYIVNIIDGVVWVNINIPCVDCVHFDECGARKWRIKDFLSARLTCYDKETLPQFQSYINHTMPNGEHLFNRSDGKYSLPDKAEELKSLNEEYLNALRSSILLLFQTCEQLISDKRIFEANEDLVGAYANWLNR